jgi:DNA replication protein DnaC
LNELVTTRIRTTATRLGLTHLPGQLDVFARRAEEGKLGYLDFLDLVLEEEAAVRDERRFRSSLRLSKLPHHKTLDQYDFLSSPSSTRARSRTWPPSPSSRTRATPPCWDRLE